MSADTPKYMDDILLIQYQQACEDYRQMDSLVWQLIPTFIVAIGGTLIAVVFSAMNESPLPAKVFVLCISFLLTIGINFIMLRHRYFQSITVGTLMALEKELNIKHIQRTPFQTLTDKKQPSIKMYPNGLLYSITPKYIYDDGIPGPKLFFRICFIIAFGILALIFFLLLTPPTGISTIEMMVSYIIFVGMLGVFVFFICNILSKEQRDIKEAIDQISKSVNPQ